MPGLILLSPAKINLFFRVLRKREDGYHDIASLFQMVSFGDTLSISLHPSEDSFSTDEPLLRWNQSNLIYRAVELFKQKTGTQFFVRIDLQKKIPMQAGLGGGSSNAATVLYGLNQLLHTKISEEVLAKWGATLGADVPSFFSNGRVFCEGIGEKLTPIAKRQESYWLIKPKNLSLSTPEVFAKYVVDKMSNKSPSELLEGFSRGFGDYVNDLETAAFELLPSLKEFKNKCIGLGFQHVVMTGSGAAFVCIGDIKPPVFDNADIIKVQSVHRTSEKWYMS